MATHRRRNLIAPRRRIVEDGEEGGEDILNGNDLDSLSDDSGLSEEEEEEEEDEDEELSEEEDVVEPSPEKEAEAVAKAVDKVELEDKTNGTAPANINGRGSLDNTPPKKILPPPSRAGGTADKNVDTEFMKNGFKGVVTPEVVLDFEQTEPAEKAATTVAEVKESPTKSESPKPTPIQDSQQQEPRQAPRHETPYERRRREHEEYKKKRDADPAFVPNRGAFFMHDSRHQGNGFRPFGRGRGGRGAFRGGMGFGRDSGAQLEAVESPWQHDAYEELIAHERPPHNPQPTARPHVARTEFQNHARSVPQPQPQQTAQIIVNLPGMKFPITFSEVPYKFHLRLPSHRPPLRSDKPVRVSLPDLPIKYIFPPKARSFVFIPRAMRPGAPGYINGAPVSRRGMHRGPTRSIYAGSVASHSISRRSSFQPDITTQPGSPVQVHENTAAPVQSRPVESTEAAPEKPVVKLPPPSEPQPVAESSASAAAPPAIRKPSAEVAKASPQYPMHVPPLHDARGTPIIPMYQPRPQKTVSVADIESPASMHYPVPYHPAYIEGTSTPISYPNHNVYGHSRQPSYQSQPSGTPLSHIPERAVHAQPFHPAYVQQATPYYYASPQPQTHAHPILHPHAHQQMYTHQPPPYTASPQYASSPLPHGTPTVYHSIPVPPPPPQTLPPQTLPGATIAQESNGTVYFYDQSTYYAAYAAATYPTMAPLTPAPEPGMGVSAGGMMYYYPPEMHAGGTVYYH
ncbi:CASC3/Barentsz eIF4AIII binding-domain-containing protein [Peziza echinospora]|nr:CASC3/Barentsz eIF4AIII binding-domain-containing protein [Peziza echinospora]